jgi:hypothetical protein
MPAMPQPNALRLVVWITLSSSLLGAVFAYVENRPHGIADFVNTELHGVLAGGLNGGILLSVVRCFETCCRLPEGRLWIICD